MNNHAYPDKKTNQMQDLIQRLIRHPDFQSSVDEIRSTLDIEPTAIDPTYSVDLELAMTSHIQSLRRKFDLDFRWETFLRSYILYDHVDHFFHGPVLRGYQDDVTGKEIISILVFSDTREEDVIYAYGQIQRHHRSENRTAGYTGERSVFYDNIERDARWYEWHSGGLSYRVIARRWAREQGEPEPVHTTVRDAVEKYEREIINRA